MEFSIIFFIFLNEGFPYCERICQGRQIQKVMEFSIKGLTPPIWQKLWKFFENISYSMVWSKDPMYDPGDIPGSRVIGSNLSPVSCVVKLLGKIHPCSVHNVFLPLFGLRKAFKNVPSWGGGGQRVFVTKKRKKMISGPF